MNPWSCTYCYEEQDVDPEDLTPCRCCGGGSFTRMRQVEGSGVVTDTAGIEDIENDRRIQ